MNRNKNTILFTVFCLLLMAHIKLGASNNKLEQYIQISIENKSHTDYLFWISDTPIDTVPPNRLIKTYFFRAKCKECLSLANLFYEDCGTITPILVGGNFLKNISPNKTFKIITTQSYYKVIKNRLVFFPKKEVENFIYSQVPSNFLYKEDNIVITDSILAIDYSVLNSKNKWEYPYTTTLKELKKSSHLNIDDSKQIIIKDNCSFAK